MDNDKIRINGKDFYVIPQCQKEDHTLCVAAESWGESTWGEGTNGQRILDAADNRNPDSLTYEWYQSLPDEVKAAMLTVKVTTDDYDATGEGVLEQTEMFVPSYTEWTAIPVDIRKEIVAGNWTWTRSYYGPVSGCYYAWFVSSNGNVNYYYSQNGSYVLAPAFYISDNLLKTMIEMENARREDKTLIFTIWPDFRITTSNTLFRFMNTACCTDLRTLYETMQEITKEVQEKYGRKVLFETITE